MLFVVVGSRASAQTIRGVVADAGDQPVSGVVVLLVDSTSHVAARALSDARGSFVLATTHAGTYRVRTLRVGFRPSLSNPISVVPGGEVTRRIVLDGLPIGLDTMRVVDRDVCRAFADSSAATYRAWEQVRTAITAAQLTAGTRSIAATTVSYDRSLDPGPGRSTGKILRDRSTTSTGYVTRAWRTQPPDTLHTNGYVVNRNDNTVDYYAPGLDMLASDLFVADHCFHLTTDKKQPALIGIAFEPTPERKRGVAEIHGTVWVERASSELRKMEFRYVNVPPEVEPQAGGQVEFVRLRDGAWAVSSWSISMPVVEQVIIPGHGAEPRVGEIQVAGGDLTLVRRGADTLWTRDKGNIPVAVAQAPAVRAYVLVGSVTTDSMHMPLPAEVSLPDLAKSAVTDSRGEYKITGISAGEHQVQVRAIGYAASDARVSFTDRDTVEFRVTLQRAVALNPVNVAATRPLLPSFEENRKLGLGHFLTRADLAKVEGLSLEGVIEQIPSAHIVRGSMGHAWAVSNRAGSFRPIAPDVADERQGAPAAVCWAQVYLNDVIVFSGKTYLDRTAGRTPMARWEPLFDLTSIAPSQIEAIEFYAGPGETPLKYQKYDPRCGVLVIWTRRSP
ncbi:MAG: carboxypeptidase regulatory-like domain-containing protein [Gemmatimonadaceae bacterium]